MTYRNTQRWARPHATVRDGKRPEITRFEDPPPDWTPPAAVGFAPPTREHEPLV